MKKKQSWSDIKETLLQLLVPAGDVVFAVTTGTDKKSQLQEKLYGTYGKDEWQKWSDKINQPPTDVCLLGIASDCGGEILRGANWGPLYLRQELYKNEIDIYDLGDIRVIPQLVVDDYLNDTYIAKCRKSLYGNSEEQLPVSPLSIAELTTSLIHNYDPNIKILSMGGDHSVSYPLLKSYLRSRKDRIDEIAIVHFDAHTDLLDERLGLPITFASWGYHILSMLPVKDKFVQIGIRASGKSQEYWQNTLGVKQYWAEQLLQNEIDNSSNEIIEHLKNKNIKEVYITFDVDVFDSKYVGATGTPEDLGLGPDLIFRILKDIATEFDIGGADIVEVAPLIKAKKTDQTLDISTQVLQYLLSSMQSINKKK